MTRHKPILDTVLGPVQMEVLIAQHVAQSILAVVLVVVEAVETQRSYTLEQPVEDTPSRFTVEEDFVAWTIAPNIQRMYMFAEQFDRL